MPGIVNANPKKQTTNLTQNNNVADDDYVKNQISQVIDKLSKKSDFYDQEIKIAKTLALAVGKNYIARGVNFEDAAKLKNILKKCLTNDGAKKYVACVLNTFSKYPVLYSDFSKEIIDMLDECAKSEDAKQNVAATLGSFVSNRFASDYYIDNMEKTINLLSKCSTNKSALTAVSGAVFSIFSKYFCFSSMLKDKKHVYELLNLSLKITNSNKYSAYYIARVLEISSRHNDILKYIESYENGKEIFLELLSKCWSLHTDLMETHITISRAIDTLINSKTLNYPKLFSEDIKKIITSTPVETWPSVKEGWLKFDYDVDLKDILEKSWDQYLYYYGNDDSIILENIGAHSIIQALEETANQSTNSVGIHCTNNFAKRSIIDKNTSQINVPATNNFAKRSIIDKNTSQISIPATNNFAKRSTIDKNTSRISIPATNNFAKRSVVDKNVAKMEFAGEDKYSIKHEVVYVRKIAYSDAEE